MSEFSFGSKHPQMRRVLLIRRPRLSFCFTPEEPGARGPNTTTIAQPGCGRSFANLMARKPDLSFVRKLGIGAWRYLLIGFDEPGIIMIFVSLVEIGAESGGCSVILPS